MYLFFLHLIFNQCTNNENYFLFCVKREEIIENVFGILQAKFHIVAVPSLLCKKEAMTKLLYCHVILYEMVVAVEHSFIRLFSEKEASKTIRTRIHVQH